MLKMEEWKDIENYEGLYQISSYGRVKSLERRVYNPIGHYHKNLSERILKTFMTGLGGNKAVSLYKNGKKRDILVKTLIKENFKKGEN